MKSESDNRLLQEFGNQIKAIRLRKGISQEELASIAGVHRTYVGMIERGEKNITLITMNKFSEALGVPVAELVSGKIHGQ